LVLIASKTAYLPDDLPTLPSLCVIGILAFDPDPPELLTALQLFLPLPTPQDPIPISVDSSQYYSCSQRPFRDSCDGVGLGCRVFASKEVVGHFLN